MCCMEASTDRQGLQEVTVRESSEEEETMDAKCMGDEVGSPARQAGTWECIFASNLKMGNRDEAQHAHSATGMELWRSRPAQKAGTGHFWALEC